MQFKSGSVYSLTITDWLWGVMPTCRLDDQSSCIMDSKAPFTWYNLLLNRLSNRFDNRFDIRLYRVYSRLSNRLYNSVWQPVERTVPVRSTRLSNRLSVPFDNRIDNRLYLVNGVWEYTSRVWAVSRRGAFVAALRLPRRSLELDRVRTALNARALVD